MMAAHGIRRQDLANQREPYKTVPVKIRGSPSSRDPAHHRRSFRMDNRPSTNDQTRLSSSNSNRMEEPSARRVGIHKPASATGAESPG